MASMFLAVSMNVSPFDRLLPEAEKSTVSAPSRRAASEKLVSRAGRSLEEQIGERPAGQHRHLLLAAARRFFERHGRVEDRLISSADRLSRSNKCRRVQAAGTVPSSKVSRLMRVPAVAW